MGKDVWCILRMYLLKDFPFSNIFHDFLKGYLEAIIRLSRFVCSEVEVVNFLLHTSEISTKRIERI
jgi:hypothetical protein